MAKSGCGERPTEHARWIRGNSGKFSSVRSSFDWRSQSKYSSTFGHVHRHKLNLLISRVAGGRGGIAAQVSGPLEKQIRFSRKGPRMPRREEKVKEAQRRLTKILKGAETAGWTVSDLARFTASKTPHPKPEGKLLGRRPFWIALAFLTFLTLAFDEVAALWIKWNRRNAENDLCVLSMPDELTRAFRPPVPCSMCRGLNRIEKVSALSPEIFEERYAYTGKPVVVTDGMTNWTAQHVFNFDFFKHLYGERMEEWSRHNCQFFPYDTEFRNLGEVFEMSEERAVLAKGTRPWYVGWSNCDDEVNEILRKHYNKPYFLPEMAETKKLDWIFMGSAGFGAPMHVDNVEHPSWQAQLRGRKKWRLEPPPECFYECHQVEIIVEPGEIIVVDTNRWYHSTLIVSDELSVTIGAEYD